MFRKKVMILLGGMCLTMALLAGCGNKTENTAADDTAAESVQTTEADGADEEVSSAGTEAESADAENTEAAEGEVVYMTNTSSVNMWAATNKDEGILAVIPLGKEIQLVEKVDSEWARVAYNDQEGYVKLEYLIETRVEDLNANVTFTVKTTANVKLRSGPSTDDTVLTKIAEGTEVEASGEEDGWYKVTYKGTEGYISADYAEKQ